MCRPEAIYYALPNRDSEQKLGVIQNGGQQEGWDFKNWKTVKIVFKVIKNTDWMVSFYCENVAYRRRNGY